MNGLAFVVGRPREVDVYGDGGFDELGSDSDVTGCKVFRSYDARIRVGGRVDPLILFEESSEHGEEVRRRRRVDGHRRHRR